MSKKTIYFFIIACLGVFTSLKKPGSSFSELQLKNPRVATAKNEKDEYLKKQCAEKGISYPVKNIFIRVFKKEAEMEVWVKSTDNKPYKLLKKYNICTVSGSLGPKRREGDGQTPEGFYDIKNFNPDSRFYLSLGVSYPNASDKIKTLDKKHPGGDIFIHGNCVSIGCMPIQDDGIKELYWLGVQAKATGQRDIEVHIFPFKMNDENMKWVEDKYSNNQPLVNFWKNLEPGYSYFEKYKKLESVNVDGKGKYVFGG